ncbi:MULTISPECIES: hypothetical protein [Pseudomonas]|uniref:hypothetical protein n=1 Tax=Pseudomonas TaxID=286 RepID=UPI0003FE36BA|nr:MULTISPECIES: hypothetical protein [Pseudomonas]
MRPGRVIGQLHSLGCGKAQGATVTLPDPKQTGMHGPPEHRYSKGAILNLPYSIDDTRVLIQYALHGLKHIYQDGLCLRQV